jgi:hypothetical protein
MYDCFCTQPQPVLAQCMLRYRSWALRAAQLVFRSVPLILGLNFESEDLVVRMLDAYTDRAVRPALPSLFAPQWAERLCAGQDRPLGAIEFSVSAPLLQVYSASGVLHAQLHGLRCEAMASLVASAWLTVTAHSYLVHYWWWPTLFLSVATLTTVQAILFSLAVLGCIVWVCGLLSAPCLGLAY